MKTRRISIVDEWMGLAEEQPYAVVTALAAGNFPGYGRVRKEEIETLAPKLKDLPVYLGHQVTPEDLVGKVTDSWYESKNGLHLAKAKIAINKTNMAFDKLRELLEENKCDSVSLQFKYETMGVGEITDMFALSPIELSFVEMPVCDTCKIDYAQFSKEEDSMNGFDDDGFVRLQHISLFDEKSTKRDPLQPERVLIKGLALKPGTFNDLEYKWEDIKDAAPSLIGQAITVDHSQSVYDVIGEVTGAWADEVEQTIYFTGFISDEDIAKKIESGVLSAISPEVRGRPEYLGEDRIGMSDVIFTGISVVARPACKGCRLTTKSLNFVKQLGKYFEKGDIETEIAQNNENYIKDDRANDMGTVNTENSNGGNTVTEEKNVEAPKVEETTTGEKPEQVESDVTVTDNLEQAPVAEPAITETVVTEDTKEAPAAEEEPEAEPAKATNDVAEEKEADMAEEKPVEDSKPQVKDELSQRFETLSANYDNLEKSHKALLAENINAKELELKHNVGENRVATLMSKSIETLGEIWMTIKDVKPAKEAAKFGGPKGEATTLPHSEPVKEESNAMLDTYRRIRNDY